MDRAQLRRRAHIALALIANNLVGDAELFQEPQDALRTGIVQMMDGEHRLVPCGDFASSVARAGARATRRRWWSFDGYYRRFDLAGQYAALLGEGRWSSKLSFKKPPNVAPAAYRSAESVLGCTRVCLLPKSFHSIGSRFQLIQSA